MDRSSTPLQQDWEEIRKQGGRVALVLGLISTGFPALIDHFYDPFKPAVEIFKVFGLTAPLSASVILIGIGVFRGWFRSFPNFVTTLGLTMLVLWTVGYGLGLNPAFDLKVLWGTDLQHPRSGQAIVLSLPILVLGAFAELYGPRLFFCSLIVGGFMAWALNRLLSHALDKEPDRSRYPAFGSFVGGLALIGLLGFPSKSEPQPPPAPERNYILESLGFKKAGG